MKYIKYLTVLVIVFILGNTKVFALDEYNVDVSSTGTITVKNAVDHSTVSDYSNILTFSNDVLTIKEGSYINYLYLEKNITITSNDKKIYLNLIDGTSNIDFAIKDLNLKTFTSNDSQKHVYETITGSKNKVYSSITSDKNITISSSNIELSSIDTYDGSIYADGTVTIEDSILNLQGKYGLVGSESTMKITNSVIEFDRYIYSKETITIENSNITSKGTISEDGYIGGVNGLSIESSIINLLGKESDLGSSDGSTIIKNNSQITVDLAVYANTTMTITDSSITTTGELSEEGYINASEELIIDNSTLNLQGKNSFLQSYDASITIKNNSNITADYGIYSTTTVKITDSNITTTGELSEQGYVYANEDLTIDNSILNLQGKTSYLGSSKGSLTIKNKSDITVDEGIFANSTMTITDSKVSTTGTLSEKGILAANNDLIIDGSTINLQGKEGLMENYSTSIVIKNNSNVTVDEGIYATTTMTITDSSITTTGELSEQGYVNAEEDLIIDNSTLNLQGESAYLESYNASLTIKNNSQITVDQLIWAGTTMAIIDSEVTTTGKLSEEGFIDAYEDLIIDNSTLNLQGKNGSLVSENASVTIKNNSNITADCELYSKTTMTITSSNITTTSTLSKKGFIESNNEMIINDSNIELNGPSGGIVSDSSSISITDSSIKVDYGIMTYTTLTIVNSDITTTAKESYDGCINTLGDVDIENSKIKAVNGLFTKGNLTLKNAYLNLATFYNENFKINDKTYDHTTISPLAVNGNLLIDNSRVVTNTPGEVPAVLVKGTISFANENDCFEDKDGKALTITKLTVSKDNFLNGLNEDNTYDSTNDIYYFGNERLVNEGDEAYTTTLNGNYTTYAETSGYYEVTLKVINGTWSDGTSDSIIVKVLLGDEFGKKYYPSNMKADKGYSEGSWRKTGDNEYTYDFIKNPKTGVTNTLGLLIISIALILLFTKYKKNITYFKKI